METNKSIALQKIQAIFPCENEFKDNIDVNGWFVNEIIPSDHPFLIRIAGQSGTGKSSQILPAISRCLENMHYINLSVARFSQFHPNYDNFMHYHKNNVRELTNGFALRALFLFVDHCIKKRVNIVLDLTFLDPAFETYIFTIAKQNGYTCISNLMCVPKKVSDNFIKVREQQSGRKVAITTSLYQWNVLPRAVKAITKLNIFDDKDKFILWSNTETKPIFVSGHNDRMCSTILNKYRSTKYIKSCDIEKSQADKYIWIMKFLKGC